MKKKKVILWGVRGEEISGNGQEPRKSEETDQRSERSEKEAHEITKVLYCHSQIKRNTVSREHPIKLIYERERERERKREKERKRERNRKTEKET